MKKLLMGLLSLMSCAVFAQDIKMCNDVVTDTAPVGTVCLTETGYKFERVF